MKNFIVFPFLLAFFPSWQIILKNYDELIFQDILITLTIVAISIISWIVITKIIKNANKAALITGVGTAFFFYFGYLQDALDGIMVFDVPKQDQYFGRNFYNNFHHINNLLHKIKKQFSITSKNC